MPISLMGVRSETLCQALQMYLCACLFCVLQSLYLLLMQGQLSGPAELLCVQTWAGEATLPCRVTKPSVQLWGSCVAISSLPTMPRVSQLGCCAGEGWFSLGESELGFMVISLLPPSSGAADSQCAQAILWSFITPTLWKCLLKCGSWRDLLQH